jgi:hypothetical protein
MEGKHQVYLKSDLSEEVTVTLINVAVVWRLSLSKGQRTSLYGDKKMKKIKVLDAQLSTTPCSGVREWRYNSTFVASAVDRVEWSASHPVRFTVREEAPIPTVRGIG